MEKWRGTNRDRSQRCSILWCLIVMLLLLSSTVLFMKWRFISTSDASGMISSPDAKTHQMNKKYAIVYAVHSFHDEVAASYVCTLYELGYAVIVYVGWTQYSFSNLDPFANSRIEWSHSLYGQCVYEWRSVPIAALGGPLSSSIQLETKIINNLSVVVFVTFPLRYRHNDDQAAITLLKHLQNDYSTSSTKQLKQQLHIIFTYHAVHTAQKFITRAKEINNMIPDHVVTYMYLSEHTYRTASRQQLPAAAVTEVENMTLDDAYRITYFYPIFSIEHILENNINIKYMDINQIHSIFTIQGNIGSKHSHRKNVQSIFQCIRLINNISISLSKDEIDKSSIRCHTHELHTSISNGKHLPYESNSQDDQRNRELLRQTSLPVLNLVGHVSDMETLQKQLPLGYMNIWSNFPPIEFYSLISKSKFLITALANDRYCTHRATSTVPAALISQIPLITSNSFLQLYPCLNRAIGHLSLNQNTECESMSIAMNLTEEQYKILKKEIKQCSEVWWNHSKLRIRDIIQGRWSDHKQYDFQL